MTAALVIIDVQVAILDGKATPERQPTIDAGLRTVVQTLRTLQDRARAAGVPVVMIQHDGPAGHRLETGTPGWEIHPDLQPLPGEAVVRKTASDSFYATELSAVLERLGARRLVIGGCMSQYCVDTTVRRAVSEGYDVTLIADGHTTGDTETLTAPAVVAHHNATLDGFDAGAACVTVRPAAAVVF